MGHQMVMKLKPLMGSLALLEAFLFREMIP